MLVSMKITVFWDNALCSPVEIDISQVLTVTVMMEAVSTSETWVCCKKIAQCFFSEGCNLRSRCRKHLKSHNIKMDLREVA